MKRWGKKSDSRQTVLDQTRANRSTYSFYASSRAPEQGTKRSKTKRQVNFSWRKVPIILISIAIIGVVAFSTTLSDSQIVLFADDPSTYKSI